MENLITVDKNGCVLLKNDTILKITEFERKIKQLEKEKEKFKKAIITEMEKEGIDKIETDFFTIKYIPGGYKQIFDAKEFRKKHGDVFDEFIKLSEVKSSIRIKLK